MIISEKQILAERLLSKTGNLTIRRTKGNRMTELQIEETE